MEVDASKDQIPSIKCDDDDEETFLMSQVWTLGALADDDMDNLYSRRYSR